MIEYRIYKSVYDDMLSGKKNIEFRLLNEKSENINQGDKIKFRVLDNDNLYILASVVEKFVFNNIDELWKHKEILSNNVLGYTKEELMSAFYDIFGKEKIINSKIVGIKFNIVKSLHVRLVIKWIIIINLIRQYKIQ